ncbi:GM16142 [Drosophila sechellia]|uniref:GM16142 n=1 Tax=Drosophila sechellia TaxID=7238 RepID=B4IIG5_DROSE|nr:GM16142 [Drosophila sechellia]
MSMNMNWTSSKIWAPLFLTTLCLLDIQDAWAKKLNASQAFDDTWNTAADLENELEQQKRSKGQSAGGGGGAGGGPAQWSSWSDWSTCSRTCDGGIMHQMRRCGSPGICRGESTRYRICNMQPCPEQQDFRSSQCSAYNDVPYDGTLYKWTPHYDYVEPCALTCRGHPAHLVEDISRETGDGNAEAAEHYDEQSVIVQLSSRVQDGTRCRSGSLDMCIQGKCQRVGCDLKIGSTKKIDGCGVCGGDGNSCSQPLFNWEMAPMSQCSVTCGSGYKMSRPICRNRLTNADVDDTLCSLTNRPEASVEQCNKHSCPPRWIADDWSTCSRLCGHGYRERMVVCAEESNAIKTRVADIMCRTPKPLTQETCIIEECPHWEVEDWTGCSVSCGQGIQMRGVECKSTDGSLSAKCDPLTKPGSMQQCSTGIHCDGSVNKVGGTIILGSSRSHNERSERQLDSSDADEDNEDEDDEGDDVDDLESGQDTDDGEGLSYADQPLRYAHRTQSRLNQEAPDEPRTMHLTNGNSNNNFNRGGDESEGPSLDPTSTQQHGSRRRQQQSERLQNGRERSRRPKSDGVQHADSSIMEDDLLWPLQRFKDSRGQHLLQGEALKFGIDLNGKDFDQDEWERVPAKQLPPEVSHSPSDPEYNAQSKFGAEAEDIPPHMPHARWETGASASTTAVPSLPSGGFVYRWMLGEWSQCSQVCGAAGSGLQRRTVSCQRAAKATSYDSTNDTENIVVGNSECSAHGLELPDFFQSCGNEACPQWSKGDWTPCQRSHCHGTNTAMQRREVTCRYPNGTEGSVCDEYEKPAMRQECYNERCKGVWRVEPWSECNAPCGRQGIKYRILQCVWYGSRRPAGNVCKHQARPPVMKVCKSPACQAQLSSSSSQLCRDSSRYCRNASAMGLCRLHRYKQKCCGSCQQHHNQPLIL